jgi:photosystem II stability/assembly factor-like uncharacterized protein
MKINNLAFLLLFSIPLACNEPLEVLATYPDTDSKHNLNSNKSEVANSIFKSIDGGETWQDISEGLPEYSRGDGFFTNDNGLYLRRGNGIYHSKPNSRAPFWEKEIYNFPAEHSGIAPGKTGIFAINYNQGEFKQKINGSGVWSPIYANFKGKLIRTVFETAGGTVFISCVFISGDHPPYKTGVYKSTDNGETWKQVHSGGWVHKMVESDGVLMATSNAGLLRSADDGENWETVNSEGGFGVVDIEPIKGGFAAITINTKSETRSMRASYDGGKTWEPIDAGLPASRDISSIIQVGEDFFCSHSRGIFRSSDKGKTWKLLLPFKGNKVLELSVSGNVIYVMPAVPGC